MSLHHICVYMYVCMYVCMYTRIYVHIYVRVWTYRFSFSVYYLTWGPPILPTSAVGAELILLESLEEELAGMLYRLSMRPDQRLFAVQTILASSEEGISMVDCAGAVVRHLAWCRTDIDESLAKVGYC